MIPSSQYFIYDDTHKSRLVSVASFLWIPFEALVRCETYTMEAIQKMIDDSDVGILFYLFTPFDDFGSGKKLKNKDIWKMSAIPILVRVAIYQQRSIIFRGDARFNVGRVSIRQRESGMKK